MSDHERLDRIETTLAELRDQVRAQNEAMARSQNASKRAVQALAELLRGQLEQ